MKCHAILVALFVTLFVAPLAVSWLQPQHQQTSLLSRKSHKWSVRIDHSTGTSFGSQSCPGVLTCTKGHNNVDRELWQKALEAIHLPMNDDINVQTQLDNGRLCIIRAVFRDYYRSQLIVETVQALQSDFGFDDVVQAHCIRAALWQIYRDEENSFVVETAPPTRPNALASIAPAKQMNSQVLTDRLGSVKDMNATLSEDVAQPKQRMLYKQVTLTNTVPRNRTYSDAVLPSSLKTELEIQYYQEFLVKATPETPTPLRAATAKTYLRHAKLFVQWYIVETDTTVNETTSLADILDESGDENSIQCFWDFCAYLRAERGIAKSYEANLWRGLGKLLKYRHQNKNDVPAMALIRRWHRGAQQAAKKAPRQSNEDMKWLDWPSFLCVVQRCRSEYESLLADAHRDGRNNLLDRKIAIALQRYLVLAIFATVPDRQRTIRELEIGSTLCHVNGIWCIRHTSEKYKTGKTYGERPLLQLGPVTPDIDAFLEQWRPALLHPDKKPHNFLFVQVRTGGPLTQDSVYQLVGRTCYQYTGQRTNPHLLRDMIVTHVRQSNQASEQELEALGKTIMYSMHLVTYRNYTTALLMGHSIAVQRSSYDRRTLTQKVAPAVDLMQKVNAVSQ